MEIFMFFFCIFLLFLFLVDLLLQNMVLRKIWEMIVVYTIKKRTVISGML